MGFTGIILLFFIAILFVEGEDKIANDKKRFSKDLTSSLFHFEPKDDIISQEANDDQKTDKILMELDDKFGNLDRYDPPVGQSKNVESSKRLHKVVQEQETTTTTKIDTEKVIEYNGVLIQNEFKKRLKQYDSQNSTKVKRQVAIKPLKVHPPKIKFKFFKWFLRKFKKKKHPYKEEFPPKKKHYHVEEWPPKLNRKVPWSKLISVDDHLRKRARKRMFKATLRQYWDYALRLLKIRKEPKYERPKDFEFLKDLKAGKYDKYFAKRKMFNNLSPEQQKAHIESIRKTLGKTPTPSYMAKKWKKWKSPYNPSWGGSTPRHLDRVPDHLTDAPYFGVPTKSSPDDPVYNYGPRYDLRDNPWTERPWDSRRQQYKKYTKPWVKSDRNKNFVRATKDPDEWKWPEKPPDRSKGEKLQDIRFAHEDPNDPRPPGQRKKLPPTTTHPTTRTTTTHNPRRRGYTSTAPWYKREEELVVKYPNGTTDRINVHGKIRNKNTNGHSSKDNPNGTGNTISPTFKLYRVRTTLDRFDPANQFDPDKYPIQYTDGINRPRYIQPSRLPRSRHQEYLENNRDYVRVMEFLKDQKKDQEEEQRQRDEYRRKKEAEWRQRQERKKHGKPWRPTAAEYRTIEPRRSYYKTTVRLAAGASGSFTSSTTTEDPSAWKHDLERDAKLKEYDKLTWEEKEWRRYQQELKERREIRNNTIKRRLKKIWNFIWPFGKKKSDHDDTGKPHKTLHDMKPKPPHYTDDASKPMPENWREQFSKNYPREEAERARKEALAKAKARGITTRPPRKYGKPGFRHHSFGQAFRDHTGSPPPSLIRPEVKAHNDKIDAEFAAAQAARDKEHQENVEAALKRLDERMKGMKTKTTPKPKSSKKT